MGPTKRREREKQELRTKILDAARELFVEEGYQAVTMRKIAEKIEYSPTALYLHFEDKDALIRALCEDDFLSFAANFAVLATIADPIERIRASGEAYIEFALAHPIQYRLMFMTPPPMLAGRTSGIDKSNPEVNAYAFLRMNVEEAMKLGRIRPDLTDVDLVAQIVWAALHGVVSLHIAKCHEDWIQFRDTRESARLMIDAVARGLLRTET